ncbi:hypothetical protein BST45_20220 [Mycobacterium shinjukuense]|nr:hypothetical protein BST45_20220 [Mycobacterium shinjukuense]
MLLQASYACDAIPCAFNRIRGGFFRRIDPRLIGFHFRFTVELSISLNLLFIRLSFATSVLVFALTFNFFRFPFQRFIGIGLEIVDFIFWQFILTVVAWIFTRKRLAVSRIVKVKKSAIS